MNNHSLRWLIVEDALQDRQGHWFEYIVGFRKGLLKLGDSVMVLVSKKADSFILQELQAKSVLPESVWHRMGKRKGALERCFSIPLHAVRTWKRLRTELKADEDYDIIFVPTVAVHHLLGWLFLIKTVLRHTEGRILLYFLSTPISLDQKGAARWNRSAMAFLMARLLSLLRPEAKSGKVVIGVVTPALRQALENVTSLPVHCLPQPVEDLSDINTSDSKKPLMFACYGAARSEKGSDLLQEAIAQYLKINPLTECRFSIQWIDDFVSEAGQNITKSKDLQNDPRVEFITHYFSDGEYNEWLNRTSVMLLPYRLSSYHLRGSRVVIEAMIRGIPVVTTEKTTLADQAEKYGSSVLCSDGDVKSLVSAIHHIEENYQELKGVAEIRKISARGHFSVREFREILVRK